MLSVLIFVCLFRLCNNVFSFEQIVVSCESVAFYLHCAVAMFGSFAGEQSLCCWYSSGSV